MNKPATPDARLRLAASLVRPGAYFADIGTDHATLPLSLLAEGRIDRAVAADVAEGPLSRARANIAGTGYEDRITLLLADGLLGMESLGLTDIAICGMGGELIASILEAAPFVRAPDVRLILQPMTRADLLRRYLASAGFSVRAERYAVSAGRAYLCLLAVYSGEAYAIDGVTAVLGTRSARDPRDTEAFLQYLETRRREAEAKLRGKREGGVDTHGEEALLAAILAEREFYEGKGAV